MVASRPTFAPTPHSKGQPTMEWTQLLFIGSLVLLICWLVRCLLVMRDGMPGPWPLPIIGNMHTALANLNHLHYLVNERYAHFGYVYRVWLGFLPITIAYHPDEVKRVFVTEQKKYDRSVLEQQGLARLLKGGLLMRNNGPEWKATREMLAPAFHRKSLKEMIPLFAEKAENLMAKVECRLGDDGTTVRDMQTEFQKLTFDVIGVIAMQFEFQSQAQEEESIYEEAWDIVLRQMMRQFYLPLPYSWWQFIYKLNIAPIARFNHAIATLESGIHAAIAHRKEVGVEEHNTDFLACMLRQQEEELASGVAEGELRVSDERIKCELLTFMFAGHDTTRSTMTWILYYISEHPEVEERVMAELHDVYGEHRSAADVDLSKLKYLKHVLSETLRLKPPAPVRGRTLTQPDVLRGYSLPAGANLSLGPFLTQNNEKFWPNPEKFDPGRFEHPDPNRHPYAYFPFGAGPRRCIGEQMAIYEILAVISMLLLRYRFTVVPGVAIKDEWSLTLSMTNGLPMTVERR